MFLCLASSTEELGATAAAAAACARPKEAPNRLGSNLGDDLISQGCHLFIDT